MDVKLTSGVDGAGIVEAAVTDTQQSVGGNTITEVHANNGSLVPTLGCSDPGRPLSIRAARRCSTEPALWNARSRGSNGLHRTAGNLADDRSQDGQMESPIDVVRRFSAAWSDNLSLDPPITSLIR